MDSRKKWPLYLFLIMCLLVAISIEVRAVYIQGRWSYSDYMPTVFGIGLSPLVQMAVTGLASDMITRMTAKN